MKEIEIGENLGCTIWVIAAAVVVIVNIIYGC
jgi:hypothetical protein